MIIPEALLLPIIIPLAGAIIVFAMPRGARFTALAAAFFTFLAAALLFRRPLVFCAPWLGAGFEFSLRLYSFSAFIVLFAAGFGFFITLYTFSFLCGKPYNRYFYGYLLLAVSFVCGAALADSLLVLLFFWEGLLLSMFGMISSGGKGAFRTAIKAFIIMGIADLCMMLGIALTGRLAGTFTISQISLPVSGASGAAFVLLMIGAIAKSGAMPFHSWIPDAATDAPLPFMALVPGAIEKLAGIYFFARISLDMFQMRPGCLMSYALMIIGAVTILLAVMMALIQKDYKRLLSYHAISQVGYMVLGIGTAVPAGIVGGLFHMVNNALYKSCLFLTGGAVERQAGTTDLEKLGGIGLRMPVTFGCFIITALSISGVPPFNGFFSKELVYEGALSLGWVFYAAAVAGSFFTAASFLKLGHAAFLGKPPVDRSAVKEAPALMLFPMIIIALICILFGAYNFLPLRGLIQPAVMPHLDGRDFAGYCLNAKLTLITVLVLAASVAHHIFAVRKNGAAVKASDHIHNAPVLRELYKRAEEGKLDPYNIGIVAARFFARLGWRVDRSIDWVYELASVRAILAPGKVLRRLHSGNYSVYIAWSLAGCFLIALFLMYY